MDSKKPFFSIIIPTLNEAKYLPLLLEDLSAQTFLDFEVILVDGNSTDSTIAKATTFHGSLPSLTILKSDKRHVCVQRNLGAANARADILIFSDADNRLPHYFLQGIKYRWESESVDLLTTYLEADIKTPKYETLANTLNIFFDLQMSIKPRFLLEAMIIISKKAFLDISGFDEAIDYAEGKSFIQNVAKKGYITKIVKDPQYTISFRRLRKYGIISVASRVAKIELAELFGPEFHSFQAKKLYPMAGGALFNKPRKVKNKFLKNITKIFKDF